MKSTKPQSKNDKLDFVKMKNILQNTVRKVKKKQAAKGWYKI